MLKDTITHSLRDAVKGLGAPQLPPVKVDVATRPEFGHFSSNIALLLAPMLKKSPREVGEMLQIALTGSRPAVAGRDPEMGIMDHIEVAPAGFINFFIQPQALVHELAAIVHEKNFLVPQASAANTILLEYSQPNTHKEFHVGHVRNVALGAALINIYRAGGYNVTALNYIGDIGNHVAKCLWGLQKWGKENNNESKGAFLGEVYTKAAQEVEAHPEYKVEVDALQRALEGGDKQLVKLWKQTRLWSLAEFKRIYKELGVSFDHFFFESEVEKDGRKVVESLLQRGIATHGEGGAIIVDLGQYHLGIFLLLKSDGATLYATKDLALAEKKFAAFSADISLHVVDERQSLYFKQLFKTLALAGFTPAMLHVPYAFVKLKEGIMSSRKGNVIHYEDIRDALVARAHEETLKRHPEWAQKKITATSHAIAIAALKFSMLRVSNNQVITFDINEALAFDGFTGPYLQYSLARIASIFKKAHKRINPPASRFVKGGTKGGFTLAPSEQHLIFLLTQFPDMLIKARETHEPSVLAKYLFELCRAFSTWYEACPVLTATPEIKKARLALLAALHKILSEGLYLLGIPVLKEM